MEFNLTDDEKVLIEVLNQCFIIIHEINLNYGNRFKELEDKVIEEGRKVRREISDRIAKELIIDGKTEEERM